MQDAKKEKRTRKASFQDTDTEGLFVAKVSREPCEAEEDGRGLEQNHVHLEADHLMRR
jgi:hypothetical protein